MNKVILIGRITKDPELKKTPQDVSVVQFTIAVNRTYTDKLGEKQADFINCVAWRGQADNLARYISKGNQIAVEGSIQTRNYMDSSNNKRYITEVGCEQITFLESKKNTFKNDDLPYGVDAPPENNVKFIENYNKNQENESPGRTNPFSDPKKYFELNKDSNNSNTQPFNDIDNTFDISIKDLPF